MSRPPEATRARRRIGGADPRGRRHPRAAPDPGGATMNALDLPFDLGRRSSPSRCSPMSCSTASISASASCFSSLAAKRQRDEMMNSRRAGVGRQRNLAGARRRRPVRGVPARLRRHHAGALSAGHRHAARRWSFAASPSNFAVAPTPRRFCGTARFSSARSSRHLRRGSCWARWCKASRFRAAPMPAAGSTG